MPSAPGRLSKVTDIDGQTLTLPPSLGALRAVYWLYIVGVTIALSREPWARELEGAASALFIPMHLLSGVIFEPLAMWLGGLISRPLTRARTAVGLCALGVVMAISLGSGGMDGLTLAGFWIVFLGSFYAALRWLSGEAPTLRLDGQMLRMRRRTRFPRRARTTRIGSATLERRGRYEELMAPLVDIVAVENEARSPTDPIALGRALLRKPVQRLVLVLRGGERIPVWCGDLREPERHWLMEKIRTETETRRTQLSAEGHDLREPAKAPKSLKKLVQAT